MNTVDLIIRFLNFNNFECIYMLTLNIETDQGNVISIHRTKNTCMVYNDHHMFETTARYNLLVTMPSRSIQQELKINGYDVTHDIHVGGLRVINMSFIC